MRLDASSGLSGLLALTACRSGGDARAGGVVGGRGGRIARSQSRWTDTIHLRCGVAGGGPQGRFLARCRSAGSRFAGFCPGRSSKAFSPRVRSGTRLPVSWQSHRTTNSGYWSGSVVMSPEHFPCGGKESRRRFTSRRGVEGPWKRRQIDRAILLFLKLMAGVDAPQ